MKKGFTMIELIFVIVILGILASVAIPRLAGTRADAEISAAVANLRTLASDLATYHTTTGGFTDDLSKMTNVKLNGTGTGSAGMGALQVGSDPMCISIILQDLVADTPAMILAPNDKTSDATCKAVLDAKSVQEFTKHEIYISCTPVKNNPSACPENGKKLLGNGILIGSSAKIY